MTRIHRFHNLTRHVCACVCLIKISLPIILPAHEINQIDTKQRKYKHEQSTFCVSIQLKFPISGLKTGLARSIV